MSQSPHTSSSVAPLYAAQVQAVTASVLATLEPLAVSETEEVLERRQGEAAMPRSLQAIQERLIASELLPEGSADVVCSDQNTESLATFQQQATLRPKGMPDAWTTFLLQAYR